MSKALRLVIKDVAPRHSYDAPNGVLKLESHGSFTVVIKEYTDAAAGIDRQISAKEAHDRDQYDEYMKVYQSKAAGGWTSQEAASQEANNKVRRQTTAQKDKEVKALNSHKETLRAGYNNVKWSWQIAGTGTSAQNVNANETVPDGLSPTGDKTFQFPKLLEGGGLCWVEAFREGTDPATGTIPNGLYVQATGTPGVLRCEWTTHDFKMISGPVNFGSEVLLHVYTTGLFGQEISVGLMDRDIFTFNDLLDIAGKDSFIAEVDVRKIEAFEDGKPGVDGLLVVEGATEAEKASMRQYIQKVTIPVLVDPKWEEKAGSDIKIYPVVKSINPDKEFEGFDRAYLTVSKGAQKLDDPNATYTNNPVLIDQIETDAAHFAPCKYVAVKATFPATVATKDKPAETPKSIYLFKESDAHLRTFRDYEIVSGYLRATKTVTLELEDLTNSDDACRQAAGHKHKGQTLKLISFPEGSKAAAAPKPSKPTETPAAPEKESPWEFKGKTTGNASTGTVGIGNSASGTHTSEKAQLEILSQSDEKISFKARYMYDLTPFWLAQVSVHPIFRYVWMGRDIAKPYEVAANTCRHSHTFKILVYPDVKWTLGLEYKNNKTGATLIGANRYDKKPPQAVPGAAKKEEPKTWTPIGEQELGISLKAKWDGEQELELTADITEAIRKKAEAANRIAAFIEKVFLGKENKEGDSHQAPTPAQQDAYEQAKKKFEADATRTKALEDARTEVQKRADAVRNAEPGSRDERRAEKASAYNQRRLDTGKLTSGLKRSVVGLDFIKPNLNLNFSWSRQVSNEQQSEVLRSQTGIFLEGTLEAKPLLGASCYLDFLALLQRAHPIALAIIAAADLTMALIGDGSRITAELRATGTLGISLNGFLNTLTGENSFNRNDRENNKSSPVGLTGEFTFSLLLQLKIKAQKSMLFVSVIGTLDVSLEAKAKWSARAMIDSNDDGFYTKYFGTFEGLEIIGKGEATIKLESNRKRGGSVGGGTEGSVKFQAIDKQPEKELFTLVPIGRK